jgi:hypothetical protein
MQLHILFLAWDEATLNAPLQPAFQNDS